MAGDWRRWARPLALAALCLSAGAGVFAQTEPTGSLSGTLTDLYSRPLEGVAVVVRNQATGAVARTITGHKGAYRIDGLASGEYSLEAESAQLGQGRVDGIVVSAGHEARVQAALAFEPLPGEPSPAAPQLAEAAHPTEPSPVSPQASSNAVAVAAVIPALASSATPSPVPPQVASTHVTSTALTPAPPQVAPAPPQVVDPVQAVVTSTLSGEQLQQLPMSGRNWENFEMHTPMTSSQADGQAQATLRGAGTQRTETTVDGATAMGASSYTKGGGGSSGEGGAAESEMGQAWAGGRGFGVAQAAIREVATVAGNVEAAANRAAGGRVSVATQSGSNGLHGQGFVYDRQNIWGAQNPFTQWVQNQGTITAPVFTPVAFTPPDHESTWGLGLGSQIRRNKLFWFGAVDSYRRNDPGLASVKHFDQFFSPFTPTPAPISPPIELVTQILSARLNEPIANAYNDYLGMLEDLAQLLGPAPRIASQWVGFGRLDGQASERQHFTLEGTGAQWNSAGGGLTKVSESYGNHSFGSSKASEEWLMGRWELFLTPNLLAVTQGSFGHELLNAPSEAPSPLEAKFLAGNGWGQLPQIVVDSRYGFTIGNPSRFGQGSYPDERLYSLHQSVDWVRGSLLVKAGFDFAHNTDSTSLLRNQTGTYVYSSVGNFISDALAFQRFSTDPLDQRNPHNCDQTGKFWVDGTGTPQGLGSLPCYSYFSQSMGPTNWWLSTNDWAGYATAQWQPKKQLVLSVGLRWEREQMPPPIANLNNPLLPGTQKLPGLSNNWGPRVGLALGNGESHWPVLRLGYGIYYGRTENATLETALTHTGSLNGDLNFFMRPTDDRPNYSGGAPPFPYVPVGEPATAVKPGAVELAPNFRNPEVHQALAALEESLPGHIRLTASAAVSLGRRLPVSLDTNIDLSAAPATITYAVKDSSGLGPIKTPQITVPFYSARLDPDYQQISELFSKANSTYEAFMVKITHDSRRGLSLRAHYTYSHAMDWNPNESTQVAGSEMLDPASFRMEYGTSNLDLRHSAALTAIYQAPWKLRGWAGWMANGWMTSGIGQFHSGLPFTMRTSGSLAAVFEQNGSQYEALGPGMNGSGGDNRIYGVGRNTFRYPFTWKADLRLGKRINLGQGRQLELLAESFNLFNHQNVTQLETIGYSIERSSVAGELPTLNFMTGTAANTTAFGQPLNINATNYYRERQIEFGLRMKF